MPHLTREYLRSLGDPPAVFADKTPVAIVSYGASSDLDCGGLAVVQVTTRHAADHDPATAPTAVVVMRLDPATLEVRHCIAIRGCDHYRMAPAGLPGVVADLAQSLVRDHRFA